MLLENSLLEKPTAVRLEVLQNLNGVQLASKRLLFDMTE